MSYEAISGSSPAQFSLKQRDELLPDLPQSLEQSAVSLLSCVAILTILCVFGLVCLVALSLKYRDATIRWASNHWFIMTGVNLRRWNYDQKNCPSISFKSFVLETPLVELATVLVPNIGLVCHMNMVSEHMFQSCLKTKPKSRYFFAMSSVEKQLWHP